MVGGKWLGEQADWLLLPWCLFPGTCLPTCPFLLLLSQCRRSPRATPDLLLPNTAKSICSGSRAWLETLGALCRFLLPSLTSHPCFPCWLGTGWKEEPAHCHRCSLHMSGAAVGLPSVPVSARPFQLRAAGISSAGGLAYLGTAAAASRFLLPCPAAWQIGRWGEGRGAGSEQMLYASDALPRWAGLPAQPLPMVSSWSGQTLGSQMRLGFCHDEWGGGTCPGIK